jgi:hypothetical protein
MEQQQRRPGAGAQMDRVSSISTSRVVKPSNVAALRIRLTEQISRRRPAGC